MRLLGKYAFELFRDCFQGLFGCLYDGKIITVDAWQLRAVITPHDNIELFINNGEQKGFTSLGKVNLS